MKILFSYQCLSVGDYGEFEVDPEVALSLDNMLQFMLDIKEEEDF